MRSQLKEDIAEINNVQLQKIKTSIGTAIKEDEKIKRMENDLKYWKIRSETLTEVCDRMFTEITDLTTRVENLEGKQC